MTGIAQAPPAAGTAEAGADGRLAEEDRRALTILRNHADHSSAFLTFNDGTLHHMPDDVDGLIAYRRSGGHLIQLCDPVCAPQDRERLLASFRELASSQRKHVMAVQLTRENAELYADSGFVVNQLGSCYSIQLEEFSLRGTRFMKVRNKLKRSARLGVTVEELSGERRLDPDVEAELDEIDADWLRGKGRLAKELAFMIGERGGRGKPYRRVFMARHDGKPVAYVTYSPVFGSQPGWLYDLTRRRTDSPPGAVELIFHTALAQLKDEGWQWLHLGLTPCVGLRDDARLEGKGSRVVDTAVKLIGERAGFVYPARTQEAFKLKWAPQLIEPEYVAFEGRARLEGVLQLMRVTRTI